MKPLVLFAATLIPCVAIGGAPEQAEWSEADTGSAARFLPEIQSEIDPVVGGRPAKNGQWPDAAGVVFYGSYVGCTGVLVAPDVVLTAQHCVGGISHVILDSTDWLYDDKVELIEVIDEIPNRDGYDIAVLRLAEKSKIEPRVIARDCVLDEHLRNGSDVTIVGFGATTESGGGQTSQLNVGKTQVQTKDCTKEYVNNTWTGCNTYLDNGAEIGAGGNGVDACFGDSGGPLYLPTADGTFLIGITSRAYAGVPANAPCRDGGIYTRPDAVIDWISDVAGTKIPYPDSCNLQPDPVYDDLVVAPGKSGSIVVEPNDPDGDSATFELIEAPLHGVVDVFDDGEIVYTADKDYLGEDSFVIRVSDDGSSAYPDAPKNRVAVTIPVMITQCGCAVQAAGPTAGWIIGMLALAWRRRRD